MEKEIMWLTLTLLVFSSTIILAFLKEIRSFFGKILSIPGAKLLVPLIIATAFIVHYESVVLSTLIYLKSLLHQLISLIANVFPFDWGAEILASILVVFSLTFLPVYAINERSIRKTFEMYPHSLLLSLVIWLSLIILFSVSLYY